MIDFKRHLLIPLVAGAGLVVFIWLNTERENVAQLESVNAALDQDLKKMKEEYKTEPIACALNSRPSDYDPSAKKGDALYDYAVARRQLAEAIKTDVEKNEDMLEYNVNNSRAVEVLPWFAEHYSALRSSSKARISLAKESFSRACTSNR